MTLESRYKQNILVVDHDRAICQALNAFLSREGYTVMEAYSSEEALTLCEAGVRPDLVLIANDLPDQDGLTTCCYLKTLSDNLDLLVILLVDDIPDNVIVDQIFAAGVADYLVKPLHPKLVTRRVRWLLESHNVYASMQIREHYQSMSRLAGVYAYEIYLTPDNEPITIWSTEGLQTITGFDLSELGHNKWHRFVHPDDIPIMGHHLDILLRGKQHVAEFRVHTVEGQIRWLRNHGYPVVDDAAKRVLYIYGVTQDMTRIKQNEETFRQQAAELQARNEDLDAFAYSVAHDLKNPISSIMGFASLMQKYYDRMDTPAVLEYLDLIMDSGYQLKEMINALLVLAGVSKMSAVEFANLDMHVLVENVQRRLTMMIRETSAKIILPETWPVAVGYAPWVEEIWMNYISNAMKYGGKPPIVELGGNSESENTVRFWVRDNGNGLTREQQERLFTPFTRLDQVKVEGHGLGLSVVQRIVERMGGAVGVHSEVSAGSVFSFTLPAPN